MKIERISNHMPLLLLSVVLLIICTLNISGQSVVVSATKMNVLYVGVDNPLSIMVEGRDCDEVIVRTQSGNPIIKTGDCSYNLHFLDSLNQMKTEKVLVGYFDGYDSVWSGGFEFRVKRVPNPTMYVGGMKQGRINHNVLMSNCIVPRMDNFDYDINFRIKRYSIRIQRSDSLLFEKLDQSENCFVREIRVAINKMHQDDQVVLFNVTVIGPDKVERILQDTTRFWVERMKPPDPELSFPPDTKELIIDCLKERILEIPSSVFELQQLRSLAVKGIHAQDYYVIGYHIFDIPPGIIQLQNLETLMLTGNAIWILPQELSELKKLQRIEISDNLYIKDISVLVRMPWLEEIRLVNCKLNSLPAGMEQMHKLKLLDVRNNNIPFGEITALQKALPKCEILY